MTARAAMVLGWFSVLAALVSIVAGMILVDRGSPAGLPLVIVFVVLIAVTIILERLAKKKHREEQGRLSQL